MNYQQLRKLGHTALAAFIEAKRRELGQNLVWREAFRAQILAKSLRVDEFRHVRKDSVRAKYL